MRLKDSRVPDSVVDRDSRRFGREANAMMVLISVLTSLVLLLWYFWDEEYLANSDDLIYDLGLIGGIMMLLQFVYSYRKRSQKMRNSGSLKAWFAVHMFIGIVAPLIIIVHSRFDIESVNGGVAFFAMLMVVFSGVIGRYLYSQVNFDLSTGRRDLRDMHEELTKRVLVPNPKVSRDIEKLLKLFMVKAFSSPPNIAQACYQAFAVGFEAKLLYFKLAQMEKPLHGRQAAVALEMGKTYWVFEGEDRKLLKQYMSAMARLARFQAFKLLFSFWRVGHVPVIYLLLISGLYHVLAVHMY